MHLSIVIVAYNSKEILVQCLNSIIKYLSNEINHEIIIVDNNSTEELKLSKFNKLTIIRNDKNLGYSKAINIGVKKTTGEYVLILNPDVYFTNNAIEEIFFYFKKNRNIGVVGCKILNFKGQYQKYSMRRLPTFMNILSYLFSSSKYCFKNYYNYDDLDKDKINCVDSISGCCMMFKRKIFDKVQGFNESYFLYFEDTQFCLDIKKIDYNIIYNGNIVINHYGGASTEKISYYYKNLLFFTSFLKFFFINIYQYKLFLINCILLMLIILKIL